MVPSGAGDLGRDKQSLVSPGRAQASLQCTNHTALCAQTPLLHKPLWEPLLWQILLGFTGPGRGQGTLGTAPQSPTFRTICKLLSEGAPDQQPLTDVPISTIVCTGLAFSQLTCLRRERCEKLETNWLPPREGSFLVQKGRKYLCGISFFFPPLHPKKKKKNTKRLSVLNGNVGFKSLRFGLTLQKKKKSDRLSDMTQKKFFPSIHVVHL